MTNRSQKSVSGDLDGFRNLSYELKVVTYKTEVREDCPMEVNQVCQVGPGTPVWVWIVRVGKGRWWPGSVLSITALEPFPIIDTRFECRSVGKNGIDGPAFVGISTTRMRYLELRDPNLKGDDRPNFVPSAIFAKPEETEIGLNDMQHSGHDECR